MLLVMKIVETSLWVSGALLIALYCLALVWGESARQQGIAAFDEHKQQQATAARSSPLASIAAARLAHTLPASMTPALVPQSIGAHWTAPVTATDADVIAVLRIARIQLEVPVGANTTEPVLLRGAGLIAGTAAPGSVGNVSIAAHRDTFFRGLKDVVIGDLIELEMLDRSDSYRVAALSVVKPTDVYVLADTGEAALTLVTCYPFYFVGNAPQRFIVRAVANVVHPQPPRR